MFLHKTRQLAVNNAAHVLNATVAGLVLGSIQTFPDRKRLEEAGRTESLDLTRPL